MHANTRRFLLPIALLLFIFLIAACASKNTNQSEQNNDTNTNKTATEQKETKKDPVELKLAVSGMTEEGFAERFKDPVEEKFDHISLTHIDAHPGNAEQLDEMIAKKNIPDLWITSTGSSTGVFNKGLAYDLRELFHLTDFDINRIEGNIMAELIARSNEFLGPEHETVGAFPLKRGLSAMYYNKDIFDLFGVPYLEDDMTWDEVAELAARFSQEKDGVQYHGVNVHFHSAFTQLGVDHQDENGNPQFDTEPAFRKMVDLMEELFYIPGNYPETPNDMNNVFFEGKAAMHVTYDTTKKYAEAPFEWDIVTYPTWEHLPGISPTSNSEVIGMTNTSEHPEDAFLVLDFLLSDEYQTEFSKKGHASPLVNEEIHKVFGEEEPAYDGVNIESLFKNTPQKKPDNRFKIEHSLEAAGKPWHGRVSDDFYQSGLNSPEFIRVLQEEGEITLKELEGKN